MRDLIQLQLPQLVEARKERESVSSIYFCDSPTSSHVFRPGRSSTSSQIDSPTSPTSPTFSLPILSSPGQTRFSSSTSSLSSSPLQVRRSMESVVMPGASKRPLTEVKEEQEREERMEEDSMAKHAYEDGQTARDFSIHHARNPSASTLRRSSVDYDWLDWPSCREDYEASSRASTIAKRQRGDSIASRDTLSRLSIRLPSLPRKWKSKFDSTKSSLTEVLQDVVASASRSRANSIRAPSIDASLDANTRDAMQFHCPRSQIHVVQDQDHADDDVVVANDLRPSTPPPDDDGDNGDWMATTPLLPPAMAVLREPLVQSPLESPTVASMPSTPLHNIFDKHAIAYNHGHPTPPLSTRPSTSSFHYHHALQPAADIPPMELGSSADPWAAPLGHANFHIRPEPYVPISGSPQDMAIWQADRDAAGEAWAVHLARTHAHHSITSKIHTLTQSKWAAIDAGWEACLAATPDPLASHLAQGASQLHDSMHSGSLITNEPVESTSPALVSALHEAMRTRTESQVSASASIQRLPTTHTPLLIPKPALAPAAAAAVLLSVRAGGSVAKFPSAAERGIVGPMVRVGPVLRPRKRPGHRNKAFWRFWRDLLPGGWGR